MASGHTYKCPECKCIFVTGTDTKINEEDLSTECPKCGSVADKTNLHEPLFSFRIKQGG